MHLLLIPARGRINGRRGVGTWYRWASTVCQRLPGNSQVLIFPQSAASGHGVRRANRGLSLRRGLRSLAALDVNHNPSAINVADLQASQLRVPNTGA